MALRSVEVTPGWLTRFAGGLSAVNQRAKRFRSAGLLPHKQAFYANLILEGMGRHEAPRVAQLAMLAESRAVHGAAMPSTWGAFVLSREWRHAGLALVWWPSTAGPEILPMILLALALLLVASPPLFTTEDCAECVVKGTRTTLCRPNQAEPGPRFGAEGHKRHLVEGSCVAARTQRPLDGKEQTERPQQRNGVRRAALHCFLCVASRNSLAFDEDEQGLRIAS